MPRPPPTRALVPVTQILDGIYPIAQEGVHWRREPPPVGSKSPKAVSRCLIADHITCGTFSRREYLEAHFQKHHNMTPSKPPVGRKKTSSRMRPEETAARKEKVRDNLAGDFHSRFWRMKVYQFKKAARRAELQWAGVTNSELDREQWILNQTQDMYRSWRNSRECFEAMDKLVDHCKQYWLDKLNVSQDEAEMKARVPHTYEGWSSEDEEPAWKPDKDGNPTSLISRQLKKHRAKLMIAAAPVREAIESASDGEISKENDKAITEAEPAEDYHVTGRQGPSAEQARGIVDDVIEKYDVLLMGSDPVAEGDVQMAYDASRQDGQHENPQYRNPVEQQNPYYRGPVEQHSLHYRNAVVDAAAANIPMDLDEEGYQAFIANLKATDPGKVPLLGWGRKETPVV